MKENQKFSKIFLLVRDVDKIKMQKSEVEDYKFVGRTELDAMLKAGDFAPPMAKRIETYMEKIAPKMADWFNKAFTDITCALRSKEAIGRFW